MSWQYVLLMPWWGHSTNVNFSILNLTQRNEDISQCPPVQPALCRGERTPLSLDCRVARLEVYCLSRVLRQCLSGGKDGSDLGAGVRESAVLVAS